MRDVVTQSIGATLQVAEQAPQPELGRQLADAARSAFVSGVRAARVVAALVAAGAAAMVAAFAPAHVPDADDDGPDVPAAGREDAATGAPPVR